MQYSAVLVTGLLLVLSQVCYGGKYPVVNLSPPGTRIQDLPGYDKLHPKSITTELVLKLTPATLRLRDANNVTLLQLNVPLYKDEKANSIHIFGPTMRIQRGGTCKQTLINNLISRSSDSEVQHDIGATNLHTHGLHNAPGLLQQEFPVKYTGGDNIFYTLRGRASPSDRPAQIDYVNSITEDHLPGLHWYHPHHHGSTTIQAFASSGMIVVDDDPIWLPDSAGCGPVRDVMSAAPEVLMHIELIAIGDPIIRSTSNAWNDANYQIVSQEGNSSMCCNSTDPNNGPTGTLKGTLDDTDVAFINGGLQPVIPMQSGVWQRWRMLHAGYKRFMDLQIMDSNGAVTTECDILLLAKDGVYLMEIPRPVPDIFLTAAGRGEVLVRCNGPPGATYTLRSGSDNGNFSFGNDGILWNAHNQTVMATIEIESGGTPGPDLQTKACKPRRPSYAVDLRDEAIAAANAQDHIVVDYRPGFDSALSGCSVNGENFTYPDPSPIIMPIGKIAEWRFHGLLAHPLHVHVNPFQIISLDVKLFPGTWFTSYFDAGDYHDTLLLPIMAVTGFGNSTSVAENPNNITLRSQPGPYGGFSVLHCHFLQHEDAGCMKVVKAVCPGFGDIQPEVCPDLIYPVLGNGPSGNEKK